MAKIKEIHKSQPQAIGGVWWFEIALDNGDKALYSDKTEEPYKVGDDFPDYEIRDAAGRSGTKKVFYILPPAPPEEKRIEVTADFGEKKSVILAAKARACIEAMGFTVGLLPFSNGQKFSQIYPVIVKAIHKQLDDI